MARRSHPRSVLLVALTIGGLWGGFAYAVLWNDTSIVVTRSFFDSPVGLVALFPVRVVLWGIRAVEVAIVRHPLHFPDNTRWIGGLAALVGAATVGVPAFVWLRIRDRGQGATAGGRGEGGA